MRLKVLQGRPGPLERLGLLGWLDRRGPPGLRDRLGHKDSVGTTGIRECRD